MVGDSDRGGRCKSSDKKSLDQKGADWSPGVGAGEEEKERIYYEE